MRRQHKVRAGLALAVLGCACLLLVSCKTANEVTLPQEQPVARTTSYTGALERLGRMTVAFELDPVAIQATDVRDDTGTSAATGGEIPFDITEMIKSALNRIGGVVAFIPYDPVYLRNQMSLGQTDVAGFTRPDAVVGGAITEFDRGLESSQEGFGVGFQHEGYGTANPGLGYSEGEAQSMSSITLDLNMADFETMTMLPRVQAVNTIRVYEGSSESEFGFSIFGASIGFSGSVHKVQGRHAAVRVLVEMSVLQIVGKELMLPYWKCLGPDDAQPDPVVLDMVRARYDAADVAGKVEQIQRLLRIYGYGDLEPDGRMTAQTIEAIRAFGQAYEVPVEPLDANFYEQLFLNVPVFEQSRIGSESDRGQELPTLVPQDEAAAPAAAPGAAPEDMQPLPATGPLAVSVRTERETYREGESMIVLVQGNRDFYARLIYVTTEGQVVQLVPNRMGGQQRFAGGQVHRIPGGDDAFFLRVSPPFGQERLVLYASEKPLEAVPTTPLGQGLSRFNGRPEEYGQLVRGLRFNEQAARPDVVEASCVVNTTGWRE